MSKHHLDDLALFGGPKLFTRPVSTSNLVKPDLHGFLSLLKPALSDDGEASLVQRLEEELAEFHQTDHCVTVCSGFWALVLAIKAIAKPGKTEVIMPSLTYRRLADVVAWTGLIPRFCEVDPSNLAISASTAGEHISPNTALIIGVHPIVNCCDSFGLEELGAAHDIPVLFDGVESVYETLRGKKIGGFGRAECFSFHASKLINGFEGGYITTQDAQLAAALRDLREGLEIGSARIKKMPIGLPAVHAAMALQGLREVHQHVLHNREIYRQYQTQLTKLPGLKLLSFNEAEHTSFKNIVVKLLDDWHLPRSITIELLNAEGILSRAYYDPPLHQKNMAYPHMRTPLPFTETASKQYMLMPCGYQVSTGDVERVIDLLVWVNSHAGPIRARREGAHE